jgi:hypothetical protein
MMGHQTLATGRPAEGAGDPPLLGRKSVLLGMLTSGFVMANVARPSVAAAAVPVYVLKWAPSTAYVSGQQVISPNNDVVSAKIAHRSAAAYGADTAKWVLSTTYAAQFTGTASTTAADITAWLAVPCAGVKRLAGDFTLRAPFTIPSDTSLDATGATIALAPDSGCPMVVTPAATPVRSGAADAMVTADSTTVRTATGGFTPADLGRTLSVSFVDEAARGSNVYARIASVNDATCVTVDIAPKFTEVGGIARIYGRDSNIHINGGTWDHGVGGGVGVMGTSLFLRRIDNVSVTNVRVLSGAGAKYMLAFGDCTNVLVENVDSLCRAGGGDIAHFQGPCSNVVVRGITGTTGDDSVAFTTTDYGAYNDCHGSFTNIHISDISTDNPNRSRSILLATSCSGYVDGHSITEVIIDNVKNPNANSFGIATWVQANDSASRIDDLHISNSTVAVRLMHTLHGVVTVDRVSSVTYLTPMPTEYGVTTNRIENLMVTDHVGTGHAFEATDELSVLGILTIRGGTVPFINLSCGVTTRANIEQMTLTQGLFQIGEGCNVGSLTFKSVNCATQSVHGTDFVRSGSTVDSINFADCALSAVSTAFPLLAVTPGGTLKTVRCSGSTLAKLAGVVINDGTVATLVFLSDLVLTSCDRVVEGTGGAIVKYINVQNDSGINEPFYANGPMTIAGTGFTTDTANALVVPRTAVVHVSDSSFRCDLSVLAKSNGDTAYNTNAALACGIGPAVSDGMSWKNVYSGAVY